MPSAFLHLALASDVDKPLTQLASTRSARRCSDNIGISLESFWGFQVGACVGNAVGTPGEVRGTGLFHFTDSDINKSR